MQKYAYETCSYTGRDLRYRTNYMIHEVDNESKRIKIKEKVYDTGKGLKKCTTQGKFMVQEEIQKVV
jgi:hypothetical protein